MRARSLQFAVWLVAVGMCPATFGATPGSTRGRPVGRAIEFVEPETPAATNSLHSAEKRAEALRRVEQDLRAPLDFFSLGTPMDGLDASLSRYLVPRAIPRAALQQREKNTEDLLLGPNGEESTTPGNRPKDDKTKKSRMEDYMKRQAREGAPWAEDDPARWRTGMKDEMGRLDNKLPDPIQSVEKNLSTAVKPGLRDEFLGLHSAREGFSDMFHLGSAKAAEDEQSMMHHKAMMQEYRRVIGAPEDLSAAGLRSVQHSGVDPAAPLAAPAYKEWGSARPSQEMFDPNFGKLRPPQPGTPEKVFGSPAFAPLPQPVDTAQRPTYRNPPKPSFEAPKRPFL